MKRIVLLFIATILLSGCATSTATPTVTTLPPTETTPNSLPEPTDHTQLIVVKAGETFDLVVPANASTGYHWKIIGELDSNAVEFVTEDYVAQEPIMPGSGGMDVWTFRGINPGDTTIELGYYPPSDETQPDETVTFSVRVE